MRSGEIKLGKEISVNKLIRTLRTIAWGLKKGGSVLIVAAMVGVGWIYTPLVTAEVNYQTGRIKFPIFDQSKIFKEQKVLPRITWEVPDKEYSIYIPKISARSRVIEDVDVTNSAAYLTALKLGVAEAGGLAHPGQVGTTYLFAHSTDSPVNFARYNAVFYLLDKLVSGDRVEISYRSQLYKYAVRSVVVLSAQDTRYLVPQKEKEQLILQTCYPPGTSWKRLVVVLDRED